MIHLIEIYLRLSSSYVSFSVIVCSYKSQSLDSFFVVCSNQDLKYTFSFIYVIGIE